MSARQFAVTARASEATTSFSFATQDGVAASVMN
jgi:hypothetical protein